MKKLVLLALLLSFCLAAVGQEDSDKSKKNNAPIPDAEVSTTKQSLSINGETIPLIARAGTMQLTDNYAKPICNFGFTSYHHENGKVDRPIVFAFNGGPGSSSFWLHMGVLGPKRIVVNDPESTPAAPYEVVNNEYSLLAVADLVMIDPVGTGVSTVVGESKYTDFWGVDQDISSIANFITSYLIEHDRMNSPKFLLGESYGTFRNAGLMNYLLQQGIAMNGVIMVSAVFDLRSLLFPPNDDMPYIAHFPTYAATAWYHDMIDDKPADVYAFLDEVRTFTEEEYVMALFKGDQLTDEEKKAMANKLAAYTGLDADYWYKADLRVQASEFFHELRNDEGERVGRLDSRFTGINQDLTNMTDGYDPQSAAISPAYITGFLDYYYNDLAVPKHLKYMTTAGKRDGFKWDWKHRGNERWGTIGAINTGIDMATALTRDPNMKVLILNGIYDAATVFYGVEHSIDHLGLPPEIKKNIIMEYYEAGHMMYTHMPSLEKFRDDVNGFILEGSR